MTSTYKEVNTDTFKMWIDSSLDPKTMGTAEGTKTACQKLSNVAIDEIACLFQVANNQDKMFLAILLTEVVCSEQQAKYILDHHFDTFIVKGIYEYMQDKLNSEDKFAHMFHSRAMNFLLNLNCS